MTNKIIVEIDFMGSQLVVMKKENGLYDVMVGDEIKHPDKNADGALAALGHYLHSLDYKLSKLENKKKTTP